MADILEDRAFVADLYHNQLGRTPDGPGLEFWTNQINAGTATREQVQAVFARSEPGRYVTNLYRDVLHRTPSAQEVSYWSNQISTGAMDREKVKKMFMYSSEALSKDGKGAAPNAPSTPAEGTTDQQNAFDQIVAVLAQYGLPAGLADWAWGEIVAGKSTSQVTLDLYDRPEFKERFPAIGARQGAGRSPLSPAEYIAYEQAAGQIMRAAGVPAAFYDEHSDVTALLTNDVSIAELSQRVSDDGLGKVANAPQSVRDAFAQFFGVQGDGALAAFFLDPARAVPLLKRQAEQASVAGFSLLGGGLRLDATRAGELVDFGVSGQQAGQAASQVGGMAGLFSESVSETGDLTAEGEGLDTVLGINATSAQKVAKRAESRVAAFSGGGGAAAGQTGIAGLGVER